MEMIKSLCMTLVHFPSLKCIQEGRQCHNRVDFQFGVKLDSISFPDIFNSCSDLIVNVHCSGESASQVRELKTTFSFCPFTVMVGSLYGFPGAG